MHHVGLKIRMLIAGTFVAAFYAVVGWAIAFFAVSAAPFVGVELGWVRATGIAVGLLLVFLVVQWWGSTTYLVTSIGAEPIPVDEEPWLHKRAAELAEEMGVSKPRLMVATLGDPNAFAIGRRGAGTVVFSVELLNLLNAEQVEAVLAHELSHLQNRDSIVMLFGQSIAGLLGFFVSGLFLTDGREHNQGIFLSIVGAALTTLVHFVVMVFVLVISRHREYVADADAAKYTGNPEAVATALERISGAHVQGTEVSRSLSALCIFGRERGLLESLLSDHPPVEKRIERLRTRVAPKVTAGASASASAD